MSRINTNVPSLVAARILNTNNNTLQTALERLSTGVRINKGKDDPAGLIASERLRSETTAISAAIDNARRADNLLSVAEGGLQEISSLLIELEGLVDRSANEAGLSSDELAANQLQVDTILDTINRIATSTEFSGRKLLNGSLDYTTSGVGTTGSAITDLKVNSARIAAGGSRSVVVKVNTTAEAAVLTSLTNATQAGVVTTLQVSGKHGAEQFTFGAATNVADVATAINQAKSLTGVSAMVSGAGATARLKFASTDYGSEAFVSVEALAGGLTLTGSVTSAQDYGRDVDATINGVKAISKGLDVSVRSTALSMDITLSSTFGTQTALTKTFTITGGGADFSIAPTLGVNSMASLGLQDMTTGSLGKTSAGFLSTLGSGQANQLGSGNFEKAQRIIREAGVQVSNLRGRLGAFQKNTLGSTINALQVSLENVTAAESAIRDTDFAQETSRLTRAQILVNAATSTLQLANAQPQSVLSLIG